jgi:hypothetical protein
MLIKLRTVKPPIQGSLGDRGSEYCVDQNLTWRYFSNEIIYLGSLKLKVK